MAKTDWHMGDIILPDDMNQIGQEVNDAASAAITAQETAKNHAVRHTEHGADPIPNATTIEGGLMSAEDKSILENMKVINVKDYGAKGDGLTDDTTSIQDAINDAYDYGGGIVYFPGKSAIYGVKSTIVLKSGVTLRGDASIGYYHGMQYYAAENTGVYGPRIKAISEISGPVIYYDGTNQNNVGAGIENIIIDANKLAMFGVRIYCASLKESFVTIDKCGIQGAKADGIRIENSLANRIMNCSISANFGYGIHGPYGASDSSLLNNYIHTCESGGIQFVGGSHHNTIIGGKIEDNYGPGINLNGDFGGVSGINVVGVNFHKNNGPDILAGNSASCRTIGCIFRGSGATRTGTNSASILSQTNAYVFVQGCDFSTNAAKPEYHLVAINNGKIFADGNTMDNANIAPYFGFGNLQFGINRISSIIPLFNFGARRKVVNISANSSGYIVFEKVLSPDSLEQSGYFGMGLYSLIIQTARFAQAGGIVAKYLVHYGKAGTSYGLGLTTELQPANSNWISSVNVSIENQTDLRVTINTGSDVGAEAGHTNFYVYLIDLGLNTYRLI